MRRLGIVWSWRHSGLHLPYETELKRQGYQGSFLKDSNRDGTGLFLCLSF